MNNHLKFCISIHLGLRFEGLTVDNFSLDVDLLLLSHLSCYFCLWFYFSCTFLYNLFVFF